MRGKGSSAAARRWRREAATRRARRGLPLGRTAPPRHFGGGVEKRSTEGGLRAHGRFAPPGETEIDDGRTPARAVDKQVARADVGVDNPKRPTRVAGAVHFRYRMQRRAGDAVTKSAGESGRGRRRRGAWASPAIGDEIRPIRVRTTRDETRSARAPRAARDRRLLFERLRASPSLRARTPRRLQNATVSP